MRIRRLLWVCLFVTLIVSPLTANAQDSDSLMLAIAHDGTLYLTLWGNGPEPSAIITDGVRRPLISPDRQHVAYISGSGQLSVVNIDTEAPVATALADPAELPATEGNRLYIDSFSWLDDQKIVFTTTEMPEHGIFPHTGLFRVGLSDAADGPQAYPVNGAFNLSPDGTTIAVSKASGLGQGGARGGVVLMDTHGEELREVLTFLPVSTGSEYPFFPALQWIGPATLRVAIPDPELVSPPFVGALIDPVALWEIDAQTDEATWVGNIETSFFGLPQWSRDGRFLVAWGEHEETPNDEFMLVAQGDGTDPSIYLDPVHSQRRFVGWTPEGARFVYRDGLAYYLGQPDVAPYALNIELTSPRMFSLTDSMHMIDSGLVYAVVEDETILFLFRPYDEVASPVVMTSLPGTFATFDVAGTVRPQQLP